MQVTAGTLDEKPDTAAQMKGTLLSINLTSAEVKGVEFIEITVNGTRKTVVNITDLK